jgi:hypothetical protein
MRLEIVTLVDVTQTNEKRGGEPKRYSQQSNFNTLIQTATLRANFLPIRVDINNSSINQFGFGKKYKDKQKHWIIRLEAERESVGLDIAMLNEDFDLVPIVLGLDETVKIPDNVFNTTDSELKNIVFRFTDL